MIDLLRYGKSEQPKYAPLKAIVAIDKDGYISILEFTNAQVANPGVYDCFQDRWFIDGIDFTDPVGLYVAELSVKDTSVNTPDGMEYDCEPIITLTHKHNFVTHKWEPYVPKQENDNSR